jgi:hypothetical protein
MKSSLTYRADSEQLRVRRSRTRCWSSVLLIALGIAAAALGGRLAIRLAVGCLNQEIERQFLRGWQVPAPNLRARSTSTGRFPGEAQCANCSTRLVFPFERA